MRPSFQDEFSDQAEDYARYRPAYPEALFAYLADTAPAHELAWDCATGSGQAAVALAAYFDKVIATDASQRQIEQAQVHPKVEYRVAPAEEAGPGAHDVDIVTVAQALHWFELGGFYAAVRRHLKTGGIIAVWSYNLFDCGDDIDPVIHSFYANTLGPYWPAAREQVEDGYRHLDFPFEELHPPALEMQARWNLEQVLGYLSTWSAVARYRKHTGLDPMISLRLQLAGLWGDPQATRRIRWPLNLRVGRVSR